MSVWSRKCKDLAQLVQDMKAQNTRIKERAKSKSTSDLATSDLHSTPDTLHNGRGLHLHVSKSPDTASTKEGIWKTNSGVKPASTTNNKTPLSSGPLTEKIDLHSPSTQLNGVLDRALSLKPRTTSRGPADSNKEGEGVKGLLNGPSHHQQTWPSAKIAPETDVCSDTGGKETPRSRKVNGYVSESNPSRREINRGGSDGGNDCPPRFKSPERDFSGSSSEVNVETSGQVCRRSRSISDLHDIPEEPLGSSAKGRDWSLSGRLGRDLEGTDSSTGTRWSKSCCHGLGLGDVSPAATFPLSSFSHPDRIQCAICVKRRSRSEPGDLLVSSAATHRDVTGSHVESPCVSAINQCHIDKNGGKSESEMNPSEEPLADADPTRFSRAQFEIYLQGLVRSSTANENPDATHENGSTSMLSTSTLSSAPSSPDPDVSTHPARQHLPAENGSILKTSPIRKESERKGLDLKLTTDENNQETITKGEKRTKKVSFSDSFDGTSANDCGHASDLQAGRDTKDCGVSTCVRKGTSSQTEDAQQSPSITIDHCPLVEMASQTETEEPAPTPSSPNLSMETWSQTDHLLVPRDTSGCDRPSKVRSFSTQLSLCSDCSSQTDDVFLLSGTRTASPSFNLHECDKSTSQSFLQETSGHVDRMSSANGTRSPPSSSSSLRVNSAIDKATSERGAVSDTSVHTSSPSELSGLSVRVGGSDALALSQTRSVSACAGVSVASQALSLAAASRVQFDPASVRHSLSEAQSQNKSPAAVEKLSPRVKALSLGVPPWREDEIFEKVANQRSSLPHSDTQVSALQTRPPTAHLPLGTENKSNGHREQLPNGLPPAVQASPNKHVHEKAVEPQVSKTLPERLVQQNKSDIPQVSCSLSQSAVSQGQPSRISLPPSYLTQGHFPFSYFGHYPGSPPGLFHHPSSWAPGFGAGGVSHPLGLYPSLNGLSPPWHPSFYPPGASVEQGRSGLSSANQFNAPFKGQMVGSQHSQPGASSESVMRSGRTEVVQSPHQRPFSSSERLPPASVQALHSTVASDHVVVTSNLTTTVSSAKMEGITSPTMTTNPGCLRYGQSKQSIFGSPVTAPAAKDKYTVMKNLQHEQLAASGTGASREAPTQSSFNGFTVIPNSSEAGPLHQMQLPKSNTHASVPSSDRGITLSSQSQVGSPAVSKHSSASQSCKSTVQMKSEPLLTLAFSAINSSLPTTLSSSPVPGQGNAADGSTYLIGKGVLSFSATEGEHIRQFSSDEESKAEETVDCPLPSVESQAVSSILPAVRESLDYDACDGSDSAVNSFLSTLIEESEGSRAGDFEETRAGSDMEAEDDGLLRSSNPEPTQDAVLSWLTSDTNNAAYSEISRKSNCNDVEDHGDMRSSNCDITEQDGLALEVHAADNIKHANPDTESQSSRGRLDGPEEVSCSSGREVSDFETGDVRDTQSSYRGSGEESVVDGVSDDGSHRRGTSRSEGEVTAETDGSSRMSERGSTRDDDESNTDDRNTSQSSRLSGRHKHRERGRDTNSARQRQETKAGSSSREGTRWVFKLPKQSKSSKSRTSAGPVSSPQTGASSRKTKDRVKAKKTEQSSASLSHRPGAASEAGMESPEETSMMLDEEFDKLLADMKPYVLKLPHKTERQRCAVWIKKLCETQPVGVTCRKTRNLYSHLMLHMLRRGKLDAPFDKKPPEGTLPPLPSYMGEYIPDWVAGELTGSFGSSLFGRSDLGNPAATSTWMSSSSVRARPHSSLGLSMEHERSLSPSRRDYLGVTDRGMGFSLDDMSMDLKRPSPIRKTFSDSEQIGGFERGRRRRQSSPSRRSKLETSDDWRKPFDPTASLGTTQSYDKSRTVNFADEMLLPKTSDRELQMRLKMMESKFHEDKLHLQQKHDAAVQKILDRKNAEIEEVKNHYRSKAKDLEETISKLERKIQTLVKESALVRETKDKQLMDLRKMLEDTSSTTKTEMEKRLHEAVADFEQEKYDLQKQHTKNIQDILDETNSRLQRMEQEYTQQASSTAQVISDLENRVHQLTMETNTTLQQRSQLESEKAELHNRLDRMKAELDDVSDRYRQLEREHQNALEAQEQEMRGLKNKTEASLEYLKQEHSLATSKAADTINELERELDRIKRNMKEGEEQRQRQLRDFEQANHQDKIHLENLHDKQVRNMKREMDQLEQEYQKKIKKMELLIAEKEQENSHLREANRDASSQAERALEEFRQQVERNQQRAYEEMKQQMDQVEQDLKKSKQVRERQTHEFARQLEEEKFQHEKELTEMKMAFEGEKAGLIRELHQQKEYILAEHEKDLEKLKAAHRAEIQDLESRLRDRQDRSQKTIKELENQLRDLREELVQANQLRKQQLVELGLLREEEKQKMQRDHEGEITRLRTEFEQAKLELQKSHSAEMEALLEKTNNRLKGIEKEYAERGQKSTETMTELQSTVNHLRSEIKRVKANAEKKAAEQAAQHEEELKNLRLQQAATNNSLQQEMETQREKVRSMERRMLKAEADAEEKLNKMKQLYEDKMKGLMPAEVRQELEETIESLKSQVTSLQQRAEVLQDELDAKIKAPLAGFGVHTSSPIKSS